MSYKFLIDECLSPTLVPLARAEGHFESTCVRDRGWAGLPDWRLAELALLGDLTLVTNNAVDFRGSIRGGQEGLYATRAVHAGLICLHADRGMSLPRQQVLFELVLVRIRTLPDLINAVLEITERADGSTIVEIYDFPTAA